MISRRRFNKSEQIDMQKNTFRVILDTNILISFLISRKFKKYDKILFSSGIQLIFSEELISEFISVIQRPKLSQYFAGADVEHLMTLLVQHGKIVPVISNIRLCRDPGDNFLLSLAEDSKANYLVTGDKDLLSLHKINQTLIITLAEFEKLF
jgi:putative PIN family toxin of toxin-antitoxin system